MICLNNTDTIEGGASVTNVVDYTISGMKGGAFSLVASGQLSDTDPSVLLTAAENMSIVSITLVNTHSSVVSINLYIDPLNAGTPRLLVPKDLELGIGYSLQFDGQRLTVSDANGNVLTGLNAAHNDLKSIQGGATDDYYHLTSAQATDLTDAGDSALHYHSADRARANHTGTQTASTISDFDTEVSNNTDVTANTTHKSSDGSDHTFIDQDVTSGSSPVFDGNNFTGIDADDVDVIDTGDYFIGTDAETILAEIGETEFHNGFDRETSASLPDISFTVATRTFSAAVKGGSSNFYFWANGKKITKTTTQSIVIPNTSGAYYIYFDNSGTIQYVLTNSVTNAVFFQNAIVGYAYWNATTSSGWGVDEMHGIRMSSSTHVYLHFTVGTTYGSGLAIEGLSDSGDTFTQITSGTIWDEDIKHTISAMATAPFLYRSGVNGDWVSTTTDANIGYNNGGSYDVWNEWTGATWQLTEGGGTTGYFITVFVTVPSLNGYPIKKIVSQSAFNSASSARNGIDQAIADLAASFSLGAEYVFIGAIIVTRSGALVTLSDGSLYYDLRQAKGTGTGSASSTTSYAADIPTDITNFNSILSASDTTTQSALDTLDDHLHDWRYYTETETDTWRNGTTQTEMGHVHGVTSDIQTQIDSKQATLTFGIADGNAVDIDSASVADNDYAKFTPNGLEGRSYSEMKADLSLDNVSNVSTDDTAYNATSWDSNADAATKNAIRDKFVSNDAAIALNTAKVTNATHTGDVTGSTALTIANDAVTYAKIQNVSATDKLLGRSTAGSGDVEEITCTAAGRALLDDADAAAQRTTLSLDNVQNTKVNFSATTNPGVGDDTGDGYSVGSIWINITADRAYTCVDATSGAAVWKPSMTDSTPQTLTGAGAVDITSRVTLLVTTGSDALTLADGIEGQEKTIKMKTDGGDGTLTPANFANGTTITFNDVGDSVNLIFTDSSWLVTGYYGVTIA